MLASRRTRCGGLLFEAIQALPYPDARALTAEQLGELVDASSYVGGAFELVEEFLGELRGALAAYPEPGAGTAEGVF